MAQAAGLRRCTDRRHTGRYRSRHRPAPPPSRIIRLMTVRIYPNPQTLADAAADEIAGWLTGRDGQRSVGLAGGSTPRLAYECLRDRAIPWRHVHAWMTDERHVPTDHPDSNAGMARRALFDHVPATLHEVPRADVVADILSGTTDDPAALVAEASRDAVWLLDSAAASRLDSS